MWYGREREITNGGPESSGGETTRVCVASFLIESTSAVSGISKMRLRKSERQERQRHGLPRSPPSTAVISPPQRAAHPSTGHERSRSCPQHICAEGEASLGWRVIPANEALQKPDFPLKTHRRDSLFYHFCYRLRQGLDPPTKADRQACQAHRF